MYLWSIGRGKKLFSVTYKAKLIECYVSDFVTIINITRIKNQENTMFAKVVLLFSLNNEVDSQINIYFCQLCDC